MSIIEKDQETGLFLLTQIRKAGNDNAAPFVKGITAWCADWGDGSILEKHGLFLTWIDFRTDAGKVIR